MALKNGYFSPKTRFSVNFAPMKAMSIVLMVMCPALANGQMCITNTEPPQITNDPRICKRMGAKLLTRRSTVRSNPLNQLRKTSTFLVGDLNQTRTVEDEPHDIPSGFVFQRNITGSPLP